MRMRSFVIGALALVVGGSLLDYLQLDPIWALVLILSVGIFVPIDKEKEPIESVDSVAGSGTREPTRVVALFILLIVIGLINLLPLMIAGRYSYGAISMLITLDVAIGLIIALVVVISPRSTGYEGQTGKNE